MSETRLYCQATRDALINAFAENVHCSREGEALVLDTPYIFGDGNLMRVYLFETEQGIVVSDGGIAAQELEMLSPTPTNKGSYKSLQKLVTESGFHWDGQISFAAPTMEAAVGRLSEMALVLHEADILLAHRGRRTRAKTREYLSKSLHARFGIRTAENYAIPLSQDDEVRVDMFAFGEQQNAAIEILEARSPQGVDRSIDQSLVKFWKLAASDYPGLLVQIYNEDLVGRNQRFTARYNRDKPGRVHLWSREEAVDRLGPELQVA